MEKDKIKELLAARESVDPAPDSVRTTAAILFSDIKGSTAYFEKYGDLRGLAMVQRHNNLLFPVIEAYGGRVVKTIGDAIMAVFPDPKGALQGAIGMQQALETDRTTQPDDDQIHIKVGLHSGICLVKDKDIYGDVVNVASRVQNQADPDQILITEDMLDVAKEIGVQFAQMGHEGVRGRIEPIEVYAVAWSTTTGDQLIEELQSQHEKRISDAKRHIDSVEQEFETAREQWRGERRRFMAEVERLTEAAERAKETARTEVSTDLQSEVRFHLEEAVRARQLAEQDLIAAQAKWETERNQLNAQIVSMQSAAVHAMEQANNPTRIALSVREKVDQRLAGEKQDWDLQWEGERRRFQAEIERLKGMTGNIESPQRAAAKQALLEKLGKVPVGSAAPQGKQAVEWEREFSAAKIQWDAERDQLLLRLQKAEREHQHSKTDIRDEILQELKGQYEPQLMSAAREQLRLRQEVEKLTAQMTEERQRSSTRIELLEQSIPAAKESVKKQVTAELQSEYDAQVEELKRLKARGDRRYQDDSEEWESERRRIRKQITKLEEELKDTKESALRAARRRGDIQE